MGFGVEGMSVNVQGDRQIQAALRKLPDRLRELVIKSGVRSSMLPALNMAKRKVPERTGQLRDSLKRFVRSYPSGVVAGFMGPSNDFKITIKTKGGKTRNIDPSNYAHLVEFGHRIVVGGAVARKGKSNLTRNLRLLTGKVVGFVPPQPFMRDSFEASKGQMEASFKRIVARGAKREWNKMIKQLSAVA